VKHHALEHFRRPPERLNCAQAVLYAYQKVSGDGRISVAEMKSLGGGRAPGGVCGALHAACTVAPDKAEGLKSRFAGITGTILCREIREAGQHSCEVCVGESARILQEELVRGQ
jgi:hypothetical protein